MEQQKDQENITQSESEANSDPSAIVLQIVRDHLHVNTGENGLESQDKPDEPDPALQRQFQRVNLDSALERDLGFDSLARAEVIRVIEQTFSITMPERALQDSVTPRDLLKHLAGAKKSLGQTDFLSQSVKPQSWSDNDMVEVEPLAAQTLIDVLEWHYRLHPNRTHIYFYDENNQCNEIRYSDLVLAAKKYAAGLQRQGVEPGTTVAIMLPTGAEYLYSFFGILLAGAIPVPVYPPANLYQLEDHLIRHIRILDNAQTKVLITFPEARAAAGLLKARVESLQTISAPVTLSEEQNEYSAYPTNASDIAFLQYTSGSTGQPKGVTLTHADLMANIRAMGSALQVDSTDKIVSWLPLYHDMGLIGAWLTSLYYAMPLVLMSPLSFIAHPARWLKAITQHRATISGAPNFAYELCLKKLTDNELAGVDLSSIRFFFNGAEPVSPKTLASFTERFARFGLRPEAVAPVYGLAELGVALAFPPLGRPPKIERIQRDPFIQSGKAIPAKEGDTGFLEFVACGQPLAGYQFRVVDQNGRELPEGQQGRLEFSGPSTTQGYYRNPEATERLIHGQWLDSGDLAYVSAGDIVPTSRLKDIIIRGGRNIYPHEVEEAVGRVDGIRKGCVAVFGAADTHAGTERLIVVAETRETRTNAKAELKNKIRALTTDLLGTPPEDIVLAPVHTILKTSSGKVRRSACKELYEKGRVGQAPRKVWLQWARIASAAALPGIKDLWQRCLKYTYACYAHCVFWMLVAFTWLTVAAVPSSRQALRAMHLASRLLIKLTHIPWKIEGIENIPDDQTYIIVANHSSYLDGIAVAAALPGEYGFVAKAELSKQSFSRLFFQKIRTHFVERFDKQQGVLDARAAVKTVESGLPLVFFPEGTFTRMPGLLPFHMGAFVAAAEAGVPIVPMVIRGTRSILRDDLMFPHYGPVQIRIGKPIHPSGEGWKAAVELNKTVRKVILQEVAEPDLAMERPII